MLKCHACASEMQNGLLICPVCSALVFRSELEQAAQRAAEFTATENFTAARDSWREALQYLPSESKQSRIIGAKIEELSRKIPGGLKEPAAEKSGIGNGKKVGFFVAIGLFLWKFKIIFAFILTKGKLLLLGLTKGSTFFSLILSLGFYWSLFGWQLAAGFLLCIYVHEMGHVFALSRYGIKATAPMFIPGFGAFVRLNERPANAIENARVGLAGPVWGLVATAACFGLSEWTGAQIFAALTRLSAWVNLFNLLPFWQLDGNRALGALTKIQRLGLAAVMLAAFVVTHEGLLILLMVATLIRAFGSDRPETGDNYTFYEFAIVLVALALLSSVDIKIVSAAQH